MARKCSVPGCRTNYKGGLVLSTFKFPNDKILRAKWERKMHREGFTATENSCVCILHFSKTFLVMEDVFKREDGSTLVVKRQRPKLKPNAYPTIVGPIAPHLEEQLPKKRKTWEEYIYAATSRK